MNIDHYENDPRQPPTAQSLVEGEVNSLVTFWPDIRDDAAISPEVAFDLLAIWAHLRRFDVASLDESLGESLTALLSRDKDAIVDAALRHPFPADWAEIADRIDETWDQVTDDDDIEHFEDAINEHFELLDRGSLVAFAVEKLGPWQLDDDRLSNLLLAVQLGEEYIANHRDVFLPAAVMASSMLDSYRHDLHEADEKLWETTLKHRVLQELIDEEETPNLFPEMTREVAQILIESTRSDESAGSRKIQFEQNDQGSLFGVRMREAFVDFEDADDFGFVELPSRSSSSEFEPLYAMPLQEPLDSDDASEAPLRRWGQLRFSTERIEWRQGKPDGMVEEATIDLEWNSSGELLVQTNGLFRRGAQYTVKVSWKTESGNIVAECESSRQLIPSPMHLLSAGPEGPGRGDFLEISHSKFSGTTKIWDCFLRVPFR